MKDVFVGYAEEKVYYRTNTIPPLSMYLLIREETSGVNPIAIMSLFKKNIAIYLMMFSIILLLNVYMLFLILTECLRNWKNKRRQKQSCLF